jgi:hypothetical protein
MGTGGASARDWDDRARSHWTCPPSLEIVYRTYPSLENGTGPLQLYTHCDMKQAGAQ